MNPALWYTAATVIAGAAFGLVVVGLAYAAAMLAFSRRKVTHASSSAASAVSAVSAASAASTASTPRPRPFVVFVLPCLNEGRVIGASIDRLLALPGQDYAVLVIDDGSEDNTAAIVHGYDNEKVRLLRRVAPDCRQGKGEALNAAYRHLVTSSLLSGRDPRDVVIAVLDADGRLEGHALTDVLPMFEDPTVGGVQIGVRINNRHMGWLPRMQDVEFVVFTDVFQRARRHLGSVGMGGNGQFMRLAALMSLGDAPWSRSLTEDLDLGVRLIAAGWRNDYCPTACVHQQGIAHWGRLVKQRTRWFQGHLQSWALLPTVWRDTHGVTRRDLTYHLTGPLLILLASLLTVSFLIGLAASLIVFAAGGSFTGWWLIGVYALSVVPSVILSQVYWLRERSHGLSRIGALGLAHSYVVYCLMWYVAGWRAAWRAVIGETGWTKTARSVETTGSTLEPDAIGALSSHDLRTVRSGEPVAARPAATALPPTSGDTREVVYRAAVGEGNRYHPPRSACADARWPAAPST